MSIMKKQLSYSALALTLVLTLFSCRGNKDNNGPYESGIFISNEGIAENASGSITYVNRDASKAKTDIYEIENNSRIGGLVQGIALWQDNAYILVNRGEPKVQVVDAATFIKKATITNIGTPRYFLGINSRKAYISSWGLDNCICVVDLYNNKVESRIIVGDGPDIMYKKDKYVYVANAGRITEFQNEQTDNKISVIDAEKNSVIKTIEVGDVPNGIVSDAMGKIWVICRGKGWTGMDDVTDTPGKIVSIDPQNGFAVEVAYAFPSKTIHPKWLSISKDGSTLYYLYNEGLYKFDTKTKSEPIEMVHYKNKFDKSFYALGYQASQGLLYCSDINNYGQGLVIRYNESGQAKDTIKTGIAPGGFAFTY